MQGLGSRNFLLGLKMNNGLLLQLRNTEEARHKLAFDLVYKTL